MQLEKSEIDLIYDIWLTLSSKLTNQAYLIDFNMNNFILIIIKK